MTDLRSVITIDVQADTFAEFQAAFEKYRIALNAMPEQWRKVMEGAQKASNASTDNIKKTADQVDKARQNAKKTDDEFNRLSKTTGSIKNNIGDSTRLLEKWAGLGMSIGIASAAFGGLKDLASSGGALRKEARGLGVAPSELTALKDTLSRFVDVEGDLQKINTARYDLSKRWAFGALGIKDVDKKSSAELLLEFTKKYRDFARKPGATLDEARARGFTTLGQEEDFLQLRSKESDELDGLIAQYGKHKKSLEDSDKTLKTWEELLVTMKTTMSNIMGELYKDLEPFAVGLKSFLESLTPKQAEFIAALGSIVVAAGLAATALKTLGLLGGKKGLAGPVSTAGELAAERAASRATTAGAAAAGGAATGSAATGGASFFAKMGKFLFTGARLGTLASGLLYSPEAGKADEAKFIDDERKKQEKSKRDEARTQGLKESTAPPPPDLDIYKRSIEGAPPELSKNEKAAILKGQILYPGQPETTKPVPLPQRIQPTLDEKSEDQRTIQLKQEQIERELKEKPKDESSKRTKELEYFALLEKQKGLLPGMLDEIYKIESSRGKNQFNPESEAAGPFQIIPKTAKGYGLSTEETYDLSKSAKVAADMFQQLMTKYKGDLDKVLAGYNFGQGKLDKLLESGKTLRDLPKETKEYIKTFRQEMQLPPSTALEPPVPRAAPQPTQGMNQQFNPTINVRVSSPAGTSVEVNTAQMANFA